MPLYYLLQCYNVLNGDCFVFNCVFFLGRLASNSTKTGDGASVPPSPSPELLAVDIFAVVQRLNAELYRCLEHQEKSIRERDR